MNYTISNGTISLTVSDMGAEFQSLTKTDGTELLHQGNNRKYKQRSPLLFPIIGPFNRGRYKFEGKRYRLPFHGFAAKTLFEVKKLSDTALEFTAASDESTKKQYPFDFSLKVIYSLEGADVKVTYQVTNCGETPMYYSIGAHTGYKLDKPLEEYELVFDTAEDDFIHKSEDKKLAKEKLIKGNRFEPSSYIFRKSAHTFIGLKSKSVVLKEKAGRELIKLSWGNLNIFSLWTVRKGNYICLEPWSCESTHYRDNDFLDRQRGVSKLDPNCTDSYNYTITVL